MNVRLVLLVGLFALLVWTGVANVIAEDKDDTESSQLQALMTEKRDLLRRQYDSMVAIFKSGGIDNDSSIAIAKDEYLLAELDLARSKEEKNQIHAQRIDNFKRLEVLIEAQVRAGRSDTADLIAAQVNRIQAEIDAIQMK